MYVTLFHYKFNPNIQSKADEMAENLKNGPLEALLNGNDIYNIPKLSITSTNQDVSTANSCDKNPVYYGPKATTKDCISMCANVNTEVLQVEDGDIQIFNDTVLKTGSYCYVGSRPFCNMNTTYAVMTINSIVCRPKFPRLFGGVEGSQILACNNQLIYDPKNRLKDNLDGTFVDPFLTTIQDVDETLPDGSFRFTCDFGGYDEKSNAYQEHPLDRFHPIRNYCASRIYLAHEAVLTKFSPDGKTFECDCGNPDQTRVVNSDPSDPTSKCSSFPFKTTQDGIIYTTEVPIPCFTLYSTLDDMGTRFPCSENKFTNEYSGDREIVTLTYTADRNKMIEHPGFSKFKPANEQKIRVNKHTV